MADELFEMTQEELRKQFPIYLVEHNEIWKDYYNEIESTLNELLVDFPIVRISHIGSTAIPDIWAKDIVDVMIEVSKDIDLKEAMSFLHQNGFNIMSVGVTRISLNKGYTRDGFADKVCHIHLRYEGDNDELYFRDYLRDNPEIATEYETLKLDLWKKYERNRFAYTNAKHEFIRKWTQEARKKYGDKY